MLKFCSIYGMLTFDSKLKASPRPTVSVILVQLNASVLTALSGQTYPPVAVSL